MTREELCRFLMAMGFGPDHTARLPDALLRRFTSRGFSAEQALQAIADDLRSKGAIYRELEGMKAKAGSAGAPKPAGADRCPKCGHPRPSATALECARCGVVFGKVGRAAGAPRISEPPAAPQVTDPGEASPSATMAPDGALMRARAFVSRHRLLAGFVVAVLVLVVVGLVSKKVQQSAFQSRLRTFDEQLAMGSREEFARSLQNLNLVIEGAAVLAARRGWSGDETLEFWSAADKRYRRFVEAMDAVGPEATERFGQDPREVRNSLCGGMKLIAASMRSDDARAFWPLVAAGHPARGYVSCEIDAYRPSAGAILVHDGDAYVLRRRKPGEEISQPAGPGGLGSGKAPRPDRDTLIARAASAELHPMQVAYRQRHGEYCDDIRRLLEDHRSSGGSVSPAIQQLVDSGKLKVESNGQTWQAVPGGGK